MFWKISATLPLFLVTGCGLGQNLIKAGTENEQYKACVLKQVEVLSASNGGGELAVERATEFVVSACKPQEDVYVVAMTDLAMTVTGSLVSREKFLEDEETTLRNDLHDLAASLVSQNLYRPMTASGQTVALASRQRVQALASQAAFTIVLHASRLLSARFRPPRSGRMADAG